MNKILSTRASYPGQAAMKAAARKIDRHPSRTQQLAALAIALAVPFLAPALSGVTSQDAFRNWYQKLEKPAWSPPGWVFAPVWTLLYLSMGVASWLVWERAATNNTVVQALGERRQQAASRALWLYVSQLVLNAAWTPIFFGLRRLDWALAEIVVLWAAIAATVLSFFRVRPAAGLLLVPYQLWVTFAGALNAVIWWRNR